MGVPEVKVGTLRVLLEAFGISNPVLYTTTHKGIVNRVDVAHVCGDQRRVGATPSDGLVCILYSCTCFYWLLSIPVDVSESTTQFTGFSEPNAFDPTSYQAYLQAKLAEIHDFVETNLIEAAQRQKAQFDKHSKECSFGVSDPVWVSIPTTGKLDLWWEWNWNIKATKSPSTFEIYNANKCEVVHINRLRHRTELSSQNGSNKAHGNSWMPAQIDYHIIVDDAPRYPVRTRRQPNWLGISSLVLFIGRLHVGVVNKTCGKRVAKLH